MLHCMWPKKLNKPTCKEKTVKKPSTGGKKPQNGPQQGFEKGPCTRTAPKTGSISLI